METARELTLYVVTVYASRGGIELGYSSVGGVDFGDDDMERQAEDMAEEYGLTDEAIMDARMAIERIGA